MKLIMISKSIILSCLLLLFNTAGFSSDYSSNNNKYSVQSSNRDNLKQNHKMGSELDNESGTKDTINDSYDFGSANSQENVNDFSSWDDSLLFEDRDEMSDEELAAESGTSREKAEFYQSENKDHNGLADFRMSQLYNSEKSDLEDDKINTDWKESLYEEREAYTDEDDINRQRVSNLRKNLNRQ